MSDSPLPVPTEQQKRTQFWQLEQAARHAPLTAICRACSRPRGEHPDGRSRHWFVPPDSSPPPAPSPATTPASSACPICGNDQPHTHNAQQEREYAARPWMVRAERAFQQMEFAMHVLRGALATADAALGAADSLAGAPVPAVDKRNEAQRSEAPSRSYPPNTEPAS